MLDEPSTEQANQQVQGSIPCWPTTKIQAASFRSSLFSSAFRHIISFAFHPEGAYGSHLSREQT
jgi:hypothetical protein